MVRRLVLLCAWLVSLPLACERSILAVAGEDAGYFPDGARIVDTGTWHWPGPGPRRDGSTDIAPWWGTDAEVGGPPVVPDVPPGLEDVPFDPYDIPPVLPDDGGADASLPPPPPCSTSGDTCPLAVRCPDLAGNIMRPVSFFGATANVTMSCGTPDSPDVVIPLTIGASGDVEIVVTPTGNSAVQVAIFAAPDCAPASEIRCGATQGLLGEAIVRASGLPPGRYFVAIKSARGNPAFVSTAYTPLRVHPPGDRCPGVAERPDDGAFTSITATIPGYNPNPDYGTICGSAARVLDFTDVVFQYTLSTPRDVTLDLRATAGPSIAAGVFATCGERPSATAPCLASGSNSVTQRIRRQPAGTWSVVVEWPTTDDLPIRTVTFEVNTTPASELLAADRCPGAALREGVPSTASLSLLERDLPFPCVDPRIGLDAVFSFRAPPAGHDAITLVRPVDTTSSAYLLAQLQPACPGSCLSGSMQAGRYLRRHHGLVPGTPQYLVAAVPTGYPMMGSLEATYWTVPATAPFDIPIDDHDRCSSRYIPVIGAEGGQFTGDLTVATDDFRATSSGCSSSGRDAVYVLDVPTRRRVLLSLTSTSPRPVFYPLLYVRRGTPCETATSMPSWTASNGSGLVATLDVTLEPDMYWVVVDSCSYNGGPYLLDALVVPAT